MAALFFADLQHCDAKNGDVVKSQAIDPKLRSEVEKTVKAAYGAMQANDYAKLSALFSEKLKKSVSNDFADKFLPQIGSLIKDKPYRLFDEFFVSNPFKDSIVKVTSGKGNLEYTFDLHAEGHDAYATFLLSGDATDEVMICLLMGKYGTEWKLDLLRGEDFGLAGKNAQQLFDQAHSLRNDGDLIDAVNIMSAANHCANPGGPYFKYSNWEHFRDFTDTLDFESQRKFPFPYTADVVKTKPQVFNVHMELYEGKLAPMIVYQSSVYLKDTVALKVENDEFHSKLGTIFTGMDRNNKAVLYRAYNEKPNGQNSPRYYGFIKKQD